MTAAKRKMTSKNVLQPIHCNIRNIDSSPVSKRPKLETKRIKSDNSQRWSLSSRQSLADTLIQEMGLGMLDSDDFSDSREDDIQPSCSNLEYDHNDTNPDLINLPGECISSNSASSDQTSKTKEITKHREELVRNSKSWDDFCIYRRATMAHRDQKDWFNCLSDEMLLMIFKWLPKKSLTNCALVCKRWHRLSSDETLWVRLDCSSKILTPGAIGHILSRQVVALRLAQSEIRDPPILPGVKAYSDNFTAKLMYLDMSMVMVSSDTLSIIFSKCSRLKKVSLESCLIDDEVCHYLSKSDRLEVLNLSNADGLTATGAESLLESCTRLKELNIAWTCLDTNAIIVLSTSLPKTLTRLNISGCRKTLQNAHVKDLVQSCPRLKELDLSDCTALTNEVLKDVNRLEDLNFLALSRCYGIHCTGLRRLTNAKSLTYLDIHGGHIEEREIEELQKFLGSGVQLNKFLFSSVARPTVGVRRSSIWGLRVRDS